MIGAAGAFDRGDYALAAVYFARLRGQFPEGSEGWRAINGQLDMTLHAGGLKDVPLDPVGRKPETDMAKMMKMGGGMSAAPERGADGTDGVGLNPLGR